MKVTTKVIEGLQFRKITSADFALISRYMELTDSRTCDYTLGGIVLWAEHFGYRMAVSDDTLFILGGREDDLSIPAFAMPLGGVEFSRALELMRSYCSERHMPLWLSAVPEDCLHLFAAVPTATVEELGNQWSDYLYDIHSFATLEGNAMKKKRNHVNHFLAEHPEARLVDLNKTLAAQCLPLLRRLGHDDSPTGRSEFTAVAEMLGRWEEYAPYFRGKALVDGGEIIGFTVGEVKADTLHVHVEKCNHEISGANEALASLFALEMSRESSRLRYLNRQDDAGDEGLRTSKLSWHPLRLLPKFNVNII